MRSGRARALTDQPARKQYYVDFQQEFADQVLPCCFITRSTPSAFAAKVHDVQIGPFNTPADRYRAIAQWYIVTRRITVGNTLAISPLATPDRNGAGRLRYGRRF